MKKTIQKRKLELSKQTVRDLSRADLGNVNGGINATTIGTCTCRTLYTCSCKHSVCDSCYNTDCCLMEP